MILALVGIILLSTVTLCYAQRHGTSVIGILRNGVSQITMDQQIIKDKWQSVLKKGGIDMVFTEMSIVDNGDGTYALIGTNADRSITSCIALSLDQNNYYELYTFQ